MEIKGDDLIFSTGKVLKENLGIIGIDAEFTISIGGVFLPEDPDYYRGKEKFFTNQECVELAEFMIERWGKFRDKYK